MIDTSAEFTPLSRGVASLQVNRNADLPSRSQIASPWVFSALHVQATQNRLGMGGFDQDCPSCVDLTRLSGSTEKYRGGVAVERKQREEQGRARQFWTRVRQDRIGQGGEDIRHSCAGTRARDGKRKQDRQSRFIHFINKSRPGGRAQRRRLPPARTNRT